ncbi:MAG: cache domain-containing protein [Desulfobacula sp.]|uniref:cache domain-containing protein n=1 Tax=Desulfobacula sp. TaxID=2593537 RepID=UPI0025B89EAF|nr:cache domain-containing protein [Desulfobacula sp.]MCD4719942.1 cache domain-containing protein [Desulfobacula sp.]
MNPFHLVKNFRIRYKLLFIYSFTFFVIMSLASLIIYSIVKRNVEKNIENELQNSTSAILNNVKTAVSVSIKNHLRATAEKNHEIIQHLYDLQAAGELSLGEAKKRAVDIILYQKIGITGYICLIDGTGRIIKHPKKSLEGLDISDHKFIQEMIAKKNGYIEYYWKNPDDQRERPKALYLSYFEPWDWMITVSSYRKEFSKLVNIDDFKKNILSLKFGKTGYSYIMDIKGNMIIHPELTGTNVFLGHNFSSRFFKKMMRKKNGKMIYPWKDPKDERFRKKLVLFNYIPEYEWIVASSSYLDEFFSPLNTIKNFIIIVGFASLILFIPISFILSSTITKPLRELMNRFNEDIIDGFSNRLVKMESHDEVGQLTFYYNSFMDKLETHNKALKAQISERKQAQNALQESKEKYRSVMEATPDPIVVYDMEGNVTYMNPAFTKVFGYTLEDSMGKKMDHFVPREHWKETMEGIGTILEGKVLPRTETQRTSRDGRLIDVTTRGSVYRDKDGNPLGSVIIHRDVTEFKRLEKAIIKTGEKERQKIGNNLHDDLCPHLIGIEGLSKVLKKKVEGHSREAGQLSDKITDLIKEATYKTRQLARGLCPVYFDHGLESSLQELVTNTRIMHRMECSLDCREKIPEGSTIMTINLYHIAQEAVQNAIRHGKADKIKITITIQENIFLLSVKDNGVGMDTSRQTDGMGLRIMNYRAKLIGASLLIDSNDTGTRVNLTLPLNALS